MTNEELKWSLVTGSTGGIGSEIVKTLASRGQSLILLNRSQSKADTQRTALLRNYPDLSIELVTADLMDTDQIAVATQMINSIPGRVDVLYNNSGVLTAEKVLSPQGFESQFAVNTLAPYLLIRGLTEKMVRPANEMPAMVVNFSSSAINSIKSFDLESLANPKEVGGLLSTYAKTKLATTMLAPALANELKAKNIYIRAIDPGPTKTRMTTGGNAGMPKILAWLAPLMFSPADKQAAKIVESADPNAFGGRTGIYVANRKEKKMPAAGVDSRIQADLISYLDRLRDA